MVGARESDPRLCRRLAVILGVVRRRLVLVRSRFGVILWETLKNR